jgi:Domain of unknown function (DUF397)
MLRDNVSNEWKRSSRCDGGMCVEVSRTDTHVLMRQSTDPDGARLAFSGEAWRGFVAGVRRGVFDPSK